MSLQHSSFVIRHSSFSPRFLLCILLTLPLASCGSKQTKQQDFFTSGSRAADQRADQRMAQHQQLAGQKNNDKTPAKLSLYQRLGADQGLSAIVSDWVSRAMADPRVNWDRANVKSGGFLHIGQHSETWKATPENVETLKTHLVQFLAVATGGPTRYTGKDIKQVHAGMKITNAEFDAAIGDMKATLDKFQINTDDQKELLAILESTRPQIVEVR